MPERTAQINRTTLETSVRVALNLDGTGQSAFHTGIPFFEHMLDQVVRHSYIDCEIEAKGDLEIDAHHTVEDVGIVFGQALKQALGDKAGICRYGHSFVPLDEALSGVVLDISGRPGLTWEVSFTRAMVGTFDVDLIVEFFRALVNHSQITLQVYNLRGENSHHQAETIFKAFGRALRMAVEPDPRAGSKAPSTKGTLSD